MQGNLVDLHGKVLRYVDYNPDQQDPVYTGPLQVLGPGFAPFKPYVRPKHFYTRVSLYLVSTVFEVRHIFGFIIVNKCTKICVYQNKHRDGLP